MNGKPKDLENAKLPRGRTVKWKRAQAWQLKPTFWEDFWARHRQQRTEGTFVEDSLLEPDQLLSLLINTPKNLVFLTILNLHRKGTQG